MARDTLLGFPAHTLPYRRGKFITLSTASAAHGFPCAAQRVEKVQPSWAFLRLYDKMVLGDERCWNAEKWIVVS